MRRHGCCSFVRSSHLTTRFAVSAMVGFSALFAAHCRPTNEATNKPPAPVCQVDGVWSGSASRVRSSGSVCDFDDLKAVRGDITMRRTGERTVWVERNGKYGHQANLDPQSCTVWTDATPSESRNVLGATVGGNASYRLQISTNNTISGTAAVHVKSTSILVSNCEASYDASGTKKM